MAKNKQEIEKIFDDNFGKFGCSRILAVKQEDFDCGCCAAAMAIDAIVCAMNGTPSDENEHIGIIKKIEKDIKKIAVDNSLSLIGEMFNADNLVKSIEEFINNNNINHYYTKINCRYRFDDLKIYLVDKLSEKEELKNYLECAYDNGVQLLIPYYVDKDNYCGPKIVTGAKEMIYAHWGIAQLNKDNNVVIFEGNKLQNGARPHDIETLYLSNQCLDGSFSWVDFKKSQYVDKDDINDINTRIKSKKNIINCNEEEVHLNGKIILIGKKA